MFPKGTRATKIYFCLPKRIKSRIISGLLQDSFRYFVINLEQQLIHYSHLHTNGRILRKCSQEIIVQSRTDSVSFSMRMKKDKNLPNYSRMQEALKSRLAISMKKMKSMRMKESNGSKTEQADKLFLYTMFPEYVLIVYFPYYYLTLWSPVDSCTHCLLLSALY